MTHTCCHFSRDVVQVPCSKVSIAWSVRLSRFWGCGTGTIRTLHLKYTSVRILNFKLFLSMKNGFSFSFCHFFKTAHVVKIASNVIKILNLDSESSENIFGHTRGPKRS